MASLFSPDSETWLDGLPRLESLSFSFDNDAEALVVGIVVRVMHVKERAGGWNLRSRTIGCAVMMQNYNGLQ